MNRNLLIGVGVIIIVIVGYMLFFSKQQTYSPQPQPETITKQTASPSASTNEITVTLLEQNDSGESGMATLMEVDGKVKVSLKLTGAPASVTQPAHIHVGACPDVGAVKYPLTSPEDGISETMLDITMAQLKSELPLGINVHKSATEAKVYVSCGNLSL